MLKDEVHVKPVSVIVPDYACGGECSLVGRGDASEEFLVDRETKMTSKTHVVLLQNVQRFEKSKFNVLPFTMGKRKMKTNGCS